MRRPGSGSSPGVLNTAFVTALMVLFAGFALTSRQAGPPPIAEFAPQALKQIDEAPEESDLSRSGTGSGASGADESPQPEPDAVVPEEQEQPEVAPDGTPIPPPRFSATCANGLQNRFDPQSPPCMPFVPTDMDNGGATSPGVTKDVIKVAYAIPGGAASAPERARAYAILGNFFATNFVMYNRRFEFVDYSPQWTAAQQAKSDAQWRAVAADLAAQGVFAVVGRQESTEFEYELARKGVISINADNRQLESVLQQYSPYLYGYTAGGDREVDNLTTYACQRLAGKTAQFAGSRPGNVPRKFAIMVGEGEGTKVLGDMPQMMREQMRRKCGVEIPPEHVLYAADKTSASQGAVDNWMLATVADGVTTILYTGDFFSMAQWGAGYDYQGYFPEYVSTSYFSTHSNFLVSTYSRPTQRKQYINLNANTQNLPPVRTPAVATVRYQDPSWLLEPRDGNNMYNEVYKPLLILASGVQLAGPNLTPTTFRDGLQRTRFPNPKDPRALGKVGFDTGDHTFVDDILESFWSEGSTGPDGEGSGAWCYPTQQRFGFQGRADWGSEMTGYFQKPCETGRSV